VCSWWDYGYWLTVLGNVTSLADNATIDLTKIENLGFVFMANETRALKVLQLYNATYILVFTTIDSSNGNWAGFGDEGKWPWMARISGKGRQRLIDSGYMDPQNSWTDALEDVTKFGNYTLGVDAKDADEDGNIEEGETSANARGQETTVYKLMFYARNRWMEVNKGGGTPSKPTYFKEVFIAGLSLSADEAASYGGIVPLVALYEVEYPG
jgi:asparagine N-glycosylation enzyme membrane subunit Stt3